MNTPISIRHIKSGDTITFSNGCKKRVADTTHVYDRIYVRCCDSERGQLYEKATGYDSRGVGYMNIAVIHKSTGDNTMEPTRTNNQQRVIQQNNIMHAITLYGDDIRAGKKTLASAIVEVSTAVQEASTLMHDAELKATKLAEAKVIQDKLDALTEEKARLAEAK